MMKQLLPFMKKYKWAFILAPTLLIVDVVAEMFSPMLMSSIVDVGIANSDVGHILRTGLMMVVLCVVSVGANVASVVFAAKASQGMGAELRKGLFYKIQSFSFAEIDRFSTSSLITRLTNDIATVQHTAMLITRMMVRAPITMVTALIFALSIDAELSLILLIAIPVLILIIGVLIKKAFPLFGKMQQRLDALNRVVQENLTGIRVVKAFNRAEREGEKFKEANENLTATAIKAMEIINLAMPVVMLLLHIATAAVYWFGGHKVALGGLLPGQLISLTGYITQVLFSMMMLSVSVMMFARSRASLARVGEVLSTSSSIQDGPLSEAMVTEGKVEFKNVSFRYGQEGENETLHDITFTAYPGETVAVVGATGSGKSTLVQLIPRLYDATAGTILVDGVDVRHYTLKNLRRGISMVLQTNTLFTGTVESNLRWGDDTAGQDAMVTALRDAGAWEFVKDLPLGTQGEVERGGLNFSGGQRQRLCIARALVQDPRILILDDSTSAVDTTTEAAIRKALVENHPHTTVFLIAQRISSVRGADRILVLDDGTIAESGTHESLMANGRIYPEIYRSQLKGGEADE